MPGGMSANSAVAVSRLGLRSRLVAAVGDDDTGKHAIACIRKEGVDCDHIIHHQDAKTFMCVVLLSPSGEKSLIKLETEAYLPQSEDLNADAFEGVRHVHMTFGRPTLTSRVLELASEKGITTSLDLEPPDIIRAPKALRSILSQVDTLFLNREAYQTACRVLGELLDLGHLKENGEIIQTFGGGGAKRIHASGELEISGFSVPSVDTTGAGDCFAAAYLVSRKLGMAAPNGLTFANAAAALSTQQVGSQTAMPTRDEVLAFIRRHGRAEGIDLSNSFGEVNA